MYAPGSFLPCADTGKSGSYQDVASFEGAYNFTLCVHGTFNMHLPSSLRLGLITGGTRNSTNHVHFTPYEPDDSRIISGVRSGSEVAIYIDLHRGLRHGVPFFISTNRVILSPGIEGVIAADYILKLRDLRTGADMNLSTARNMFTASDK